MRIHQNDAEEEAPINMTPMIDMVFLLLIFFLVATTIANEEREANIQLPNSSLEQPLSAPPKQLIINILEDGSYKVAAQPRTEAELRQILSDIATNHPNRQVLIRADERSIHKYFAGVAAMCREQGVNEINIGYVFSEPR